jgi:legumain
MSSDHIIVMAYDDIAFDDENPFPGTLYNKQGGVDVYEGCVIDFFGDDVNKNNFDAVMKGDLTSLNLTNEKSTGRVLETDADTKLFLYFSDHGAPGHVMFPNDLMYADELNDTIQFMYDNQMY